MEQEIIQAVVKKHWYSSYPKWLKIVLLVISIVTVVYWVGRLIAIILEAVRTIGELVFDWLSKAMAWIGNNIFGKDHFYTCICCLFIAIVACTLICEFVFDLGVFELIINWALDVWETFRQWCTNLIKGYA